MHKRYLRVEIVRFEDGTVDQDSTTASFTAMLLDVASGKGVGMFEDERIASAVSAVFDANPCAYHNQRAVIYGALRNLGITDPADQVACEKDIKRWLDDRTDKNGCDTGLPFVSKKGAGGGVLRRGVNPNTATV